MMHPTTPRLRIADIVQMDAVDVVARGDFFTDVGDIVGRAIRLRVHVALLADALHQRRIPPAHRPAPNGVPLAYGYGHHPGVQLHSSAVALVNGILQGIPAWCLARHPRQTALPRFYL